MGTCRYLSVILLAILSRVSAERPLHRVFATLPNGSFLQNVTKGVVEPRGIGAGEDTGPMQDVEVTGFITKHGDIFELSGSQSMGSIEGREEPELEPGMTMCRYGTIVVYSDTDCNTFFRPSQNLGEPVKTENKVDVAETEEKPLKKKKKKTKGNRRKPNKNNARKRRKNKKNKKRKNSVRRKALKQGGKKRRNNLNQKRKKNLKKQRKQRRGNKGRKRITDSETRSNSEPMQFAILYERL